MRILESLSPWDCLFSEMKNNGVCVHGKTRECKLGPTQTWGRFTSNPTMGKGERDYLFLIIRGGLFPESQDGYNVFELIIRDWSIYIIMTNKTCLISKYNDWKISQHVNHSYIQGRDQVPVQTPEGHHIWLLSFWRFLLIFYYSSLFVK